MSEVIIQFQDVSKVYSLYASHVDRVKEALHPFKKIYHQDFKAIDNVSISIRKGETVAIVGRNGSGKSTLLQLACGILKPTAGEVNTHGRVSALLELGAGFNPEFTGRENVYLNASILGLKKREIDDCFGDIESFADIGRFIDQPVKIYSSGMYVRLAFAVAINVNPDILVVDEALAVGDNLFQAKCFAKFQEFQDKGVTIVFVTHALDLVTRYCSKAFLLEKGALHASGSSKEVVDEYNRLIVGSRLKAKTKQHTQAKAESDNAVQDNTQWTGLFQLNPDENRYGNDQAVIIECGIFSEEGEATQILQQGGKYEIRVKVLCNKTIDNPIVAYTIKDLKGLDITGTNTWYRNIDMGTCQEGETVMIIFTQRMLLNAGNYLISFGCAGFEASGYVIYERRYDYMAFDVVSETKCVGIVDLESEITSYKLET